MRAETMLVAAGLAGVAWIMLFVGLLVASGRRRSLVPGPTGDVEATPAVVNLLANGTVTREAVTATFVDLCISGDLEPVVSGDGSWACRAAGAAHDQLTPYERSVLDDTAVRLARSPDGQVRAAEVGWDQPGWWNAFRAGVVDDALARGLVGPRWSRRTRNLLLVLAVIPCVLLGVWAEVVITAQLAAPERPRPPAFVGALLAYFLLAVTTGAYAQSPRATAAGEAVAAHWLGAITASPAAVTGGGAGGHDRLAAYAAALRGRWP